MEIEYYSDGPGVISQVPDPWPTYYNSSYAWKRILAYVITQLKYTSKLIQNYKLDGEYAGIKIMELKIK